MRKLTLAVVAFAMTVTAGRARAETAGPFASWEVWIAPVDPVTSATTTGHLTTPVSAVGNTVLSLPGSFWHCHIKALKQGLEDGARYEETAIVCVYGSSGVLAMTTARIYDSSTGGTSAFLGVTREGSETGYLISLRGTLVPKAQPSSSRHAPVKPIERDL